MPNVSPRAPDPVLTALGHAIVQARNERGVSQEALAHNANIDRAYMSAIERGKQNIGVLHLARISRALDMTMTELVMEAAL